MRAQSVAAVLRHAVSAGEYSPGEKLNEEEVKAFCQGQIAHYKIPRFVHVVDDFPMTVTGKVMRRELRRLAEGP